MGLDQYLYKHTYVKQYEHKKDNNVLVTVERFDGSKVEHIDTKRISGIQEEVMYWRKANQIHRWFVENVQNGVDDCGEYNVDRDELLELVRLCKEVLENPDHAENLLPSSRGFFFGSVDYGDWYFDDLKRTVETIESVLNEDTGMDMVWFTYSSSW